MSDLERLLEAQIPNLRRYARALTRDRDSADDLVQDCLERAVGRWAQLRRQGSLRAWLFSILHNLHHDRLRWRPQGLAFDATAAELEAHPATSLPPGEWLDLVRALDRLPEEQRQTVLLVGMEGFTYAEAATITGVPIGTVMSRLARGRERLRILTGDGDEAPTLRRVK